MVRFTKTSTFLCLFALATPALSQRQNDADYTLLESAYDPLISSLDKQLNPVSLDDFLGEASNYAISSTQDMKDSNWYNGGLRFGKGISVEGDDAEWEAYGISTVADSGFKSEKYDNVTAVSWGSEKGGLRVTFLRESSIVKRGRWVYGHALLVEPERVQGVVSFKKVENGAKEHGFVWRGKWLIVTGGDVVRVFDTEKVWKVESGRKVGREGGNKWGGGGYGFVIPQVKTLSMKNKDIDFPITIAALDRNHTSPCLLLGSTSNINSNFTRYEFSTASTTVLSTSTSKAPTEAEAIWSFKTNIKHTRGFSYASGEAYISSGADDAPSASNSGGYTDLLVWKPGHWSDEYNNHLFGKPQGTSYDPSTNTLYTVGRVPNANDNGDQYILTLDLSLRNSTAPTVNGGGPVTVTSPSDDTTSKSPFRDILTDILDGPDDGTGPLVPVTRTGAKALPQGAIAGIAVGCICAFFALSICLYLYLHHRRYSSNPRSVTAASQRKWNEKANISGTGRTRGGKGGHIELSATPVSSTAELESPSVGNFTTVTSGGPASPRHGPFGTGHANANSSPVTPGPASGRSWELGGQQRYEKEGEGREVYYEVDGEGSGRR
ncbi:hypothetical protein BJ508DRAFT_357059 [Ascobolus immersus RN42]|uniref:Concanavalin A-like lectin/glucanase n=1 Tax=Ascobolus immersus RN42 TaxID=1160509 RepID=A0A3N4IRP3_ASCIM|nr:hypothetical protein BJ508DRAFT_357059 [Ascobolus immersus RN42]